MTRLWRPLSATVFILFLSLGVVSFAARNSSTAAGSDIAKAPRLVILIRHAAKPSKSDHSIHLTPTGVERAQRIPMLFSSSRPAPLPRPDVLFATHASPSSNREVETLEPLAQALHLPINNKYSEDEIDELAAEIFSGKYAGKVVLVCWHHGKIPAIAAALGVPSPPRWSDSVFDRIWTVEWAQGSARMTDLPENLLPGDSP